MCLIAMAPSEEFGMDRNKFLRTAQRKRSINKKKAEPNMRIEALLEATCKRLRLEIKFERKRLAEEAWHSNKKQRYDYFSDDDSDSSDSDFDFDDFDGDCNRNFIDEDQPSMCTVPSKRVGNHTVMVSESESSTSCVHNSVSDSRTEKRPVCLWDDPQQVEDFFREVDTDHDPEKNYVGNLDLDKELFNPLRTCSESLLTPCAPSCNLNSFTSEFDCLYREMFQKLSAVESIVTLQQSGHVISV